MSPLYLGWDVGAWHCDRGKRKSQDALCAVESNEAGNLTLVGRPWRGNLRATLAKATSAAALLELVQVDARRGPVVLAVDTPLGWPITFHSLLRGRPLVGPVEPLHEQSPLIWRFTERFLAGLGIPALSAVENQIGSQSTKAIQFLLQFQFRLSGLGVWQSGGWTAIEAYPAPCSFSEATKKKANSLTHAEAFKKATRNGANRNVTRDLLDAIYCALTAELFDHNRHELLQPPLASRAEISAEGWIWVPTDVDVRALKEAWNRIRRDQ